MTEPLPRIVFMGTPEFAVASLRALHKAGCDIAAVVTVPDRPAGRGRKITFSPVKEYALEHDLRLLQPEKLRDPGFIAVMQNLKADMFVVVAFRMLPETVWKIPPHGTFNLHASLLPQYRGAAPINHAIINGETRTGVTTFLIDSKIDTGMILLSRETEIYPDENAGSLHDRLMEIGAGLTVETAEGLFAGKLKPVPQKKIAVTRLKPAPRIFPADTVINWREPAAKVHNLVRGLSPYPGAMTLLHRGDSNLRLKILESSLIEDIREIPGFIIKTDGSRLIVSCVSGGIEILSLVPEGRKRMSGAEFLRGFDPSGWELA
ncbi:MAG: methionyl-tRNA formyltransferase [Bacteroidales bacterium]|nr:methionyl-tRNA formyltransferase [Bacteroidales bacterium]MCB9027523.1 methionyl-tRNA formyltransferase [Bacteroidales bacterium]HOO66874.1 methionyl-tRNA formyltransferase [Bacteroidales bacterium]HPE22823.1 methionyl-tRNA formyltransferase [Bacteroidales bacterium]HPJ05587.1 methionyl-tRNA formyltransferase [Bacteroidales bacterium]